MVTISSDVGQPRSRRSYSLRFRRSQAVLRICGVIDLLGAGLLLLFGAVLLLALPVDASTGKDANVLTTLAGLGTVCFVFGLIFTWAGVQMTWGRVYLTPDRITSMNLWIRRASISEVARIDIRRSDWGKLPRLIPFVVLGNGTSFKLMPLSLASANGFKSSQLGRQLEIVNELRSACGADGDDYQGAK